MIVAYYKNQKIMLHQKGGKVTAKVGGVTVATDHATAQDARAAAQAFIDELEGEAVHGTRPPHVYEYFCAMHAPSLAEIPNKGNPLIPSTECDSCSNPAVARLKSIANKIPVKGTVG
jgi:hypothetical protein